MQINFKGSIQKTCTIIKRLYNKVTKGQYWSTTLRPFTFQKIQMINNRKVVFLCAVKTVTKMKQQFIYTQTLVDNVNKWTIAKVVINK